MKVSLAHTRICVIGTSLCLLHLLACNGASPVSELSSPSQAVRDAAAKILRETFKPPARTNWNQLVKSLKPGMARSNVLKLLAPKIRSSENGGGTAETESEVYRLDDLWIIQCYYNRVDSSKKLLKYELKEQLQCVHPKVPDGFSGIWIEYYVNGEKCGQSRFRNGLVEGECVSFYPDGSKWIVNHVSKGVLEGDEICYYPSGKAKHTGTYLEGTQTGKWIWYKENGAVESAIDFGRHPESRK